MGNVKFYNLQGESNGEYAIGYIMCLWGSNNLRGLNLILIVNLMFVKWRCGNWCTGMN